jgi:hypothetical protein
MQRPKLASLIAMPLTAGGCGVLTWVEKPNLMHRLVQHPILCVLLGMLASLIVLVTCMLLFGMEMKATNGEPESEDSLANQLARDMQNGRPGQWL